MTTELTKAAQQALEALDEIHAGKRHPQLALAAAHNLRRALTQRPAAQTEREAFEAWWESDGPNTSSPYDAAISGWNAGRSSLPAPQQATPGWSYTQTRRVDENTLDIGRVVAFADEQATPEPVGWTDADADAARLSMELECLLLDTKDTAAVSRWWKSANEALDLHRARLAAAQAKGGAE